MPQRRTPTSPPRALPSVYSIGEAATAVGVSRETLRIWEREQLICPLRTRGGHRQFTAEEIQRLHEIVRLRGEVGLNAAAIRRELGPPSPAGLTRPDETHADLGPRLRLIRREHGWSLAEVAERA